MANFKGVFPAIITPFDHQGELNVDAFRQVMESNIQAGANGFWICGGTGESVYLTSDEISRVAEASVDQSGGRATTIVHVGSTTTSQAVRNAKASANAGADAICCVPPFFYGPSEQSLVDFYKTVVDAADGLPLFVYNLPQSTGTEITSDIMETLVREIPELKGVKHSAPNFENIRNFASLGISVFSGNGYMLLAALCNGAIGGIDGPLNIAPQLWVEVYNHFQSGDIQRAMDAQERANKLMDLTRSSLFPAVFKHLVGEQVGVDCGDPRPPLPALSKAAAQELSQKADSLGLLPKPAAVR
ncbi:dihydrodipicolinate synthase family protein [SAR202 cluster bacterium AD-804-J14_MRT_500m]|nr:dihydrodipicolinate synthase family protein [SAR202 cluster bacterium AD-804-J14_MRT_500m]